MAAPILQFKRGNAGVAGTVPALRPGEPAISLNNFDFFIGIDTSVINNKFFGSHRYWEREDGTESLKFKLVDKDGTNSINLKTPDTLSGIVTYTLPENIIDTYFLKTNSFGVLEWSNQFPSIAATSITAGIATFTDPTDNTLGNADTGAVQIDGGLGVNKNVTIGGNLNVQGYSEFVGVATFRGGTINLGDENTDDINVGGEFISGLVPNTDDSHDLGASGKRWKTLNVVNINTTNISASGISTFTGLVDANGGLDVTGQVILNNDLLVSGISTFTGAIDVNGGGTIDNIQIGVTGDNEIDTSSGNLTIDSAGGTTTIDDELIVSGDVRINGNDIKASDGTTAVTMSSANVTVAGDLTVGGNDIKASDGTTALTLVNSTGAVTAASDLTVTGNLYVSGNTTQVNTAALTVEDRTIDLGIVNGSVPAAATTWDLGVLFNYYTGGAAKKSAVVWEHADTRFKFASVLGADTNGSNNDTPQLTVTTFAPIEIGALWVTDCAGTSQVISCTGTTRNLENITIDAGTF